MTQPPRPFPADRPPGKVLVVRLGALGDIVRTLPAVRLARSSWPEARIVWVVEEGGLPLLQGHPDVDGTILLPRRTLTGKSTDSEGRWTHLRRFLESLRRERPEVSLDFQGSLKSGLVAWLSGAPLRVGFAPELVRERSHLFSNVHVPLDSPRIHRVERAAALVRACGVAGGRLEVELGLREHELAEGRARARELVGDASPVLVAPFSSRRQSWKRFPSDRWCRIVEGLRADGWPIVIVHGPDQEEEEARRLGDRCGGAPCGPASIRELASLIAAGRLMVAGDTGPMHLAWAAGLPVVAIYGPTDPVLNAPFGTGHAIVAPPRPTARDAEDRYPGVDPERVLDAARGLLNGRP
jgi:lipopolysaccharide heptosyltransferase I